MDEIKKNHEKNPTFSIVMPAYNAGETISNSIASILSQSYKNFELLIVNDYSSDNTKSIIQNYIEIDPRIKLFDLNENNGVAEARNIAIKYARGKYITFLDADDTWLKDKLLIQEAYFQNDYDLVYSAYTMVLSEKNERNIIPPPSASFKKLLEGNFIGNLTGAYNCEKLGKFYQKKIGHEDYLMWLEIVSKAEKSIGIAIPLARYRVSASSLSSNKIKSIQWTWDIYRKHIGLGLIESAFYFFKYMFKAINKRM